MRRKIVLCVLAVSLFAVGCGQTKQAGQAAQTTSGIETPADESQGVSSPKDTDSVSAAVMDSNLAAVDKGPGVADEEPDSKVAKTADSWVDVSELGAGDEVVTDSTVGEGFNVIPGEIVQTSETSKEVKIGDVVTVETAQGTFDLTIDSIRLTDERSAGIPADRVVEVTYTYANTHNYEDLIVGELSFMMTDSEGKALASYIFDPTKGNHPQPMPIGSGEERTISIGYILPEGAGDDITLIYRASFEEENSFEFNVKATV